MVPTHLQYEASIYCRAQCLRGRAEELMKSSVENIALPMAEIFNSMIRSGVFPDDLKIAKVIPLYKSGDSSLFTNYRPISLLPAFSKVFERLIYNRLHSFLEKYNILFTSQYGFRKQSSTEHATLELIDSVVNALNDKHYALAVFIDLSKAFDTLDHNILLDKLWHYGIRGVPHKLFKSYLEHRKQFVINKDTMSDYQSTKCGVPQGSILGPLLFLIYINDMPLSSHTAQFILFADDTSLLFKSKDLSSLTINVNSELTKISHWISANKLSLNIGKTKCMLFQNTQNQIPNHEEIILHGNKIEKVDHFKFLGIWIDKNLNWKKNTNEKCKKIAQLLAIINKVKPLLQSCTLKQIYNALVQPHLSFGLLAWYSNIRGNLTNISRLFKLQKKAVRLIDKSKFIAHTDPIFKKFNILKLEDLFIIQGYQLYDQIMKKQCPKYLLTSVMKNNDLHSHVTRQSNNIHLCFIRTEIKKQGLFYKLHTILLHLYNVLHLSLNKRHNLKQIIIKSYSEICLLRNCYSCLMNSIN